MFTIILLQLVLLFTCGKGDEPKLECLNNYESKIMCTLSSPLINDCFEYKLNLSYEGKRFHCRFEDIGSQCKCTFTVVNLIMREEFAAILSFKENVLLTLNKSIEDTIKFNAPSINSVSRTENGDYTLTLNTTYNDVVYEELIPQLHYGIEGNSFQTVELNRGAREYSFLGRHLKPNSNYIVRVRLNGSYGENSDYSEPYIFKTSSNLQSILKVIIPTLCVILIGSILTIYYCYTKIVKVCSDKIPTPKIPANFAKQLPIFHSLYNDVVPVHFDSPTLENIGEKTGIPFYQTDIFNQNSNPSLRQEGNSDLVIYAQTGYESAEGNSTGTNSQCDPQQMSACSKVYENVEGNESNVPLKRECSGSSGLDNKAYFNSFCSPAIPNNPLLTLSTVCNQNEQCLTLVSSLTPLIHTDFDYSPCTGCSESSNPNVIPSNEIFVVPDYQSVAEVMDGGNTLKEDASENQELISSHNDLNLIMTKQICNKNPQDAFIDCHTIIPLEGRYKDFESLRQNTGKTGCLGDLEGHHFTLSNHCGSAVHVSSGIEIDSSYHRV